jgi:hypothetical protein
MMRTQILRIVNVPENYVLNGMLALAIGMAGYTSVRHILTSSDITLDKDARDHGDGIASNPRYAEKAKYYNGGLYGWITR